MVLTAVATMMGLLAAAGLGRAAWKFDQKMVAAGQRRKLESEAYAAAAASAGRSGRLAASRTSDGTVHYAVELDGDDRVHRLAFEKPDVSGEAVSFRLLPE